MDAVTLRGVRAYGRHGANPGERERRQRRACRHQHMLTAVDHVGDRAGVQRRAALEVPEVLAAVRVERHHVTRSAGEYEAGIGRQDAGP